MVVTSALVAAVVAAIAATLILWANPGRNVNRAIFSCSLHFALWLVCLHLAFTRHPGLPWLRLTCAVGAWLPMQFWIVKEAIVRSPGRDARGWGKRHWAWGVVCTALAVVCFTEWFVPAHSTPQHRIYGWAYYGFIAANLGLFAFLLRDAWLGTRRLTGLPRLELQLWLLGGCATAGMILALMTLSALTHNAAYVRLQPIIILFFFTGTAYMITTHRVLDARQVFLVSLGKLALVSVVAAAAYVLDRALGAVLPDAGALVITTGVALLVGSVLNAWLDQMLRFYPQAAAARMAAFEIARRETRSEAMIPAFTRVIQGWGQTPRALIVCGVDNTAVGGGEELVLNSPAVRALLSLRWATPERLTRERSTPDRDELARLLGQRGLGVITIAEGPTLKTIVGAGIPASRRPFTFPQVTQLLELASIIGAALERAHFSAKAQQAEQLATVGLLGAGLAHEIRNPLVTIKTFTQLLPHHYSDAVFREKFFGLIGDEVTRIDQLTEQLLELASPRAYRPENIELHAVLQSGLELVTARANDKRVEIRTELQAQPDRVMADAAAVRQVLLNLCLNAIQAVERQPGERWLRVTTRNRPRAVEIAVEDSGPGIAPEVAPHLFEPFRSTKSSGFGLGLAVCADIVARLDGTLTVDPKEPGCGARFRVTLPSAVAGA